MYSFPCLEPVCCSMSSSNCCFLTCIQISQEAGQVLWYSHLFKNFPQFVVMHTVKGFGTVNKADVFLELSCFFLMVQRMLAISSLVPLPFLNPAWTSGSSRFTYYWSLAWRILSITLLACEMVHTSTQFSANGFISPMCLPTPILLKNIHKAEPEEVRQESTSSQGSSSLALWIWRNNHPYSLASSSQDIRVSKPSLFYSLVWSS